MYTSPVMKQILVIAFAVSSLLKPGLVLCVESGGDVRLERPAAFCCATESAAESLSLQDAGDDCHGCLDFGLGIHSLASQRTSTSNISVAYSTLPACAAFSTTTTHFISLFQSYRPAVDSATSTTVLRC